MTSINPAQLRCLSTLVSKLGINKETKETLVQAFSEGRATSSKDLLSNEAAAMIKHLKELDPDEKAAEKMRKKMIAMAHEMGWTLRHAQGDKPKADMKRIDDWCKKFGYLHKSLDNYTYKELPKLVSQFENGPYRHYMNAI